MTTSRTDELLEAIRALPPQERLRLVERVIHDVAEVRDFPVSAGASVIGLFSDVPDVVDRICEEVGAPQPKRIDVDCNVNASAGFRRGMLSMFGNDMVLTIGLPLAAGLTLQEFGGVLAHEFGHFSQGLGMRLSYLVRAIIHWFVRVVYQRDQWDEIGSATISGRPTRS